MHAALVDPTKEIDSEALKATIAKADADFGAEMEAQEQAQAAQAALDAKDTARDTAALNALIVRVGDKSNLILDPDLDSYYMMDATLLALPQTQDRMATMVLNGAELLKQKTLTAPQRTQIAVAAASGVNFRAYNSRTT